MRLRRAAAFVAAALALSLALTSPAHAAVDVLDWRGVPISVRPLPVDLRLAGAGPAWSVTYLTTSWDGRPTVVTGTITVPAGRPPRGGWPVVSFGHGFSGTADGCAPSRTGPSPWERAAQEALLAAGYVIAVTDYEGVGTPRESSLVDGPSEAYALIDVVRTTRFIAPASREWVAVGYSLGGHAALFAASIAPDYAPSLRHAGTIGLAPVTQWGLQLQAARDPAAPVLPTVPYSGRSLPLTHRGEYRAEDYFTPRGLELVELAGRACIDEMAAAVVGLTNADVFLDTGAAVDAFARLFAEEEVPVARYAKPVRLAHGTADQIPIVLTQITAGELAAAGTDVTVVPVEGADHFTLLPTIAAAVVDWTDQLRASG